MTKLDPDTRRRLKAAEARVLADPELAAMDAVKRRRIIADAILRQDTESEEQREAREEAFARRGMNLPDGFRYDLLAALSDLAEVNGWAVPGSWSDERRSLRQKGGDG